MKTNLCLAVGGAILCAALPAMAVTSAPAAAETSEKAVSPAETVAQAASLKANIKRIAVEYLEQSVTNKDDPNYPDSDNADEQHNISGGFDGNLTYDSTTMAGVSGLTAIYGQSKTI